MKEERREQRESRKKQRKVKGRKDVGEMELKEGRGMRRNKDRAHFYTKTELSRNIWYKQDEVTT